MLRVWLELDVEFLDFLGLGAGGVGPFEQDRTDKGFLPSFRLVDAAASTGRAGVTASYRSPITMPDGQIMASYAPTAGALAWRLVAVNPRSNAQTTLLSPPGGRAYVDAVLAIKYPARVLFLNRRQLVFGGGTYRYESGFLANAEVFGREFTASVLPGWRFRKDSFILPVFAGLDVQDHRLSPDDPSNKLRGTSAGFRGGFELWYEPNAGTMVSADVFSTMIGPSYSGHAAFGWRVFDRFYLGPEIQAFAYDNSYRQFRAGAHITAFKTETAEWSAGAGWARDSDHREGVYGRVGVLMRR